MCTSNQCNTGGNAVKLTVLLLTLFIVACGGASEQDSPSGAVCNTSNQCVDDNPVVATPVVTPVPFVTYETETTEHSDGSKTICLFVIANNLRTESGCVIVESSNVRK